MVFPDKLSRLQNTWHIYPYSSLLRLWSWKGWRACPTDSGCQRRMLATLPALWFGISGLTARYLRRREPRSGVHFVW
jgi:hypothetical protein